MTDRLAHPPHLPVAALVDRQLDQSPAPHAARPGGRGAAVLQLDAVAQRSQRALPHSARRRRARGRSWGPHSAGGSAGWRARRRWSAGSARCCRRRAARRDTAAARRRARARRPSGARGCRARWRRTPSGLLHRVHDPRLGARQRAPVDLDAIARPTSRAGSVTISPSTAHTPFGDQRLGGAPRGDARVGEVLGQAHTERLGLGREPYSGVGPPPARASPARSSRSRSSACSSGVGSQRATSGSSCSERRPNSFRNSVLVRYVTAPNCERPASSIRPRSSSVVAGRVGADAADARDLRARHRLQVGDDRQRLGLRGRERGRARTAEQAPGGVLGGGVGRERVPAAELAQHDPARARARTARRAAPSAARIIGLAGLGRFGQLGRRSAGRARGTAAPRSCSPARRRPRAGECSPLRSVAAAPRRRRSA